MKKLKDSVMFQKLIDGNMMLFDPTTGNFMTVNEVGTLIIECLQKHYSIEKIIDNICELYEVDRITVKNDIVLFIKDMEEKDLLTKE